MLQSLPEVAREVGGGMVPPRVSWRVDSPFCLSPALAQESEHTWDSAGCYIHLKDHVHGTTDTSQWCPCPPVPPPTPWHLPGRWRLLCLVLYLSVGSCFPFQPLPCPSAHPTARLSGCPASGSAWHGALGIGPAPPPLSSPAPFLSYCHAWSVPGPPPSEAFLDNYFLHLSTL